VRLTAPVLAALCAALLFAAPGQARSVPRGWLGVQADGPLTEPGNPFESEWSLMAASGVESVRTAFDWRTSQPSEGGPIDFSRMDAVVVAAAQQRLPVLPVVHRTPGWAARRPSDGAASAPRGTAAYTAFLTALARRYGPTGSLWAERPDLPRLPIRYWQIWNEPNLTLFWTRQPFAKSYVALLKASRRALRVVDAKAKIVLAGLPNISWVALRQIYRAGGRGEFDVVALHPYTRPINLIRLVRLARRETRRFRDPRVPIWITEMSWTASRGKARGLPGLVTDERGQAARLRAALSILARARKRFRIQKVIWYTWLSREGSRNPFDWAGLRRLRGDRLRSARSLAVFRQAARRIER
jgi:hypothetical protein